MYKVVLCLIFLAGLNFHAHAQSFAGGSHYVEAHLDFKSAEVRDNHVVISYVIPYSGMVEIRLFDKDGEKVWQNQYADTMGENTVFLRRAKFNPNQTYTLVFNYKKDEIRELLVVPPH